LTGGDEGTIGWSAAPTLVERQRENLTERLKREFGLFLNDDEEERARKQGKRPPSPTRYIEFSYGHTESTASINQKLFTSSLNNKYNLKSIPPTSFKSGLLLLSFICLAAQAFDLF
jgi:hypothetical protein